MMERNIYGGENPLEIPMYTAAEAARYLHIPVATVRAWTVGRKYKLSHGDEGIFKPLIQTYKGKLAFLNLVELHVLQALRKVHSVKINDVRKALRYAEKEYEIERLLLSEELLTAGGNLFIERYGELVSLNKAGQIAIKELFKVYLTRIERDNHLPIRLYPFVSNHPVISSHPVPSAHQDRPISIDPRVSFGEPTITGHGITTKIIVMRINNGESVEEVAEDYDLSPDWVTQAIIYEQAA